MSACREYGGRLDAGGYARVVLGGRKIMLHRWVVEQVEGPLRPWPEEVVMHTCDNPACFLYEHLRRATSAENNADCIAKGRAVRPRGTQHPNAKLTDEQVAEVRSLVAKGIGARPIAARFGVSRALVRAIISGHRRREETP